MYQATDLLILINSHCMPYISDFVLNFAKFSK